MIFAVNINKTKEIATITRVCPLAQKFSFVISPYIYLYINCHYIIKLVCYMLLSVNINIIFGSYLTHDLLK